MVLYYKWFKQHFLCIKLMLWHYVTCYRNKYSVYVLCRCKDKWCCKKLFLLNKNEIFYQNGKWNILPEWQMKHSIRMENAWKILPEWQMKHSIRMANAWNILPEWQMKHSTRMANETFYQNGQIFKGKMLWLWHACLILTFGKNWHLLNLIIFQIQNPKSSFFAPNKTMIWPDTITFEGSTIGVFKQVCIFLFAQLKW